MNVNHELIVIKYKFIPDHIINTLLQFTKQDSISASVITIDSKDQHINDSYRKTNTHKISDEINNNIKQTVFSIHEQFLKSKYNSLLKQIEIPQLLSYGIGGKYDEHNDCEDWINGKLQKIVSRDITMIWYLNDDYEGGELEFTQLQLTFKPKRGDMIIFPSYYEFTHKVHPVTSGLRCSLVTWLETEKRIYERLL